MEALIAIQADHLSKLESSEKNYRKSPKDRIKRQYLEARLESLEALWQDFKTTHRQIIPLVTAEQKLTIPYFAKNVYDMFEELYIYYKATMREALQPFLKETIPSGSTSASLTQQYGSCGSDVKLPRIQLPTFNGKYNEWQTFYDMFVSLIHNNTNLSNVQKLHYLKSSLSGEPERLLSNFSTTAQNYDEAWKQLTKRYNNKRYNCNAIIKMLLSQKSILQESASAIRQLLDATTSCLKALQNLKIDTSTWDPIIVYIVVSKLDAESCRQWESQQGSQSDELPTWSSLANFLESRFRSLEMVDSNKQVSKVGTQSHHKKAGPSKSFHTALENQKVMNLKCTFCNGAHYMYSCKNFATLSQQERQDFVQNNGLCFNCLSPNHSVMRCRQSTSCRKCGRRHHSLLHFDKGQNQGLTNQETTNEMRSTETHQRDKIQQLASTLHTTQTETNIVANFSKNEFHSYHVLLATAILNVRARNSNKYVVRALIDQGSQASFITEAIVQMLGLKRFPVNGVVSGLGNGKTNIKYKVSVQLESRFNPDIKVQVSAYVLNSLTTLLPSAQVPELDWLDLDEITLADPRYSSPGKIDILLGADIYGEILLSGMIKSPSGNSIAQNTIFGWVLSGKIGQCPEEHNLTSMHIKFTEEEFDLRRFWEIEAEPDSLQKKLSETERKCEEIYERTTTRDNEGRFIVKLPFKNLDPQCQYGQSREIAEKKLDFLLRRLIKNPRLYHDYQHVLEEYVSLNHMTLVEKDDIDNPKAVYLPHHAVVRADKETTKVRIVFNASSKGTNGVSLNDDLLVGPKLQQDLRHLIMRWRSHQIVIVADLEKMYRQVRVKDEDTNFQRILWKQNKNGPVQHYKLLTLTFGTACAPYLAVKTLQHLADVEKTTFPKASLITKNDFYIDDLMTGGETESEVIEIYEEMKGLMKSGKFTLQKWSSNSQSFLKYIEDDNLHSTDPMTSVPIKDSNRIKVLGLSWNRLSDNFEYIISLPDFEKPVTKRLVLSDIARLYDPMGWIAPVVIVAKLIMQKVWRAGLDWDDQITEPLLSEWLEFREKLIQIGNINIPRWIRKSQNSKMELHVFSDASRTAYAAAVYLKTIDINNKTNVCLLTAKTKVAPLDKVMSVPRLELSGADLAAKLILEVGQVMNIPKEKWYAWTDSTVVLAWLRGGASRWATFVSHRVSNILTILDYERWGHVSTSTNPVDCASRGLTPEELQKHLLWWNGPHWLLENKITLNTINIPDTNEEERVNAFTVNQREKEFLWDKFSSLNKMLKIMSYCRRFLNYKLEQKDRKQMPKEIQIREMNKTLTELIKQVQNFEFESDIKQLNTLSKKSPLHTLCPFVDQNGVLRVGGRIHQANINYEKKHPIILPTKSHLTKLIVSEAHRVTLHGGPQVMLNYLRSRYWILRARNVVKKCCRECVTCLRHSKTKRDQLMGQLPGVRLKPSKPFQSTGVDYAGPIKIRFSPGRGSKSYKGYICVFVCMVTRAIHLEVVSDLSAKGFLAAFRRFVSRRGHCQNIYSDNGTNFVGADKMLRDMLTQANRENPGELAQLLLQEGTQWHFIPPYAPNFGGLWEAGVRSVKVHLRKVIGDSTLTFEELYTVLTQIEACLNSRPLTALSDNPDDPLPLTPGHFLVGEPLISIPDYNNSSLNVNNLERWRLVQKMVNQFWSKWSKEYLVNLSHRYKWFTKRSEPNIGDIVVVRDDNLPPCKWLLGKITEKHTGPDNIARVVTIKCKHGLIKRALSKICVLLQNCQNS